jgi:hypothetical protein
VCAMQQNGNYAARGALEDRYDVTCSLARATTFVFRNMHHFSLDFVYDVKLCSRS